MTAAYNTRELGRAMVSLFAVGAMQLPLLAAAGPAQAPASALQDEPMWSYQVQSGDNLFELSAAYLKERTSWRELQRLNRVADPLRLQPGTQLRMPIRLLRREASVAHAVFVQGDVSLQRAPEGLIPLRTGDELRSGDALRTGEQATLTLRFVDGSRLLVAPRSEVTLQDLLVYGRSAIPAMRLELREGSADSKVVPSPRRPADYQLRTPSLSLGVRGTEFRVQVSEGGRTAHAEVLEGVVSGSPASGAATKVPAGYGLAATVGAGASALTRLLPAPSLDGAATKLERIPLTLSWPALEGAVAYRAQIFDGDEHLLLDGRFVSPRAQWADLPDGRYQLRLRGIDSLGLEGLAANLAIQLKARPEPPFSQAPAPDALIYGDSAALAWTRPLNVQRFHLQIASDAEFKTLPLLLDRNDLAANELKASLPPGPYFWRLASVIDGPDEGPFGDPRRFELKAIPPTPPLQSPDVDDKSLRFNWAATPGAARYELQWASDAEFSKILAEPRTDQPSLTLPRPPGGTYYLRVRSVDELGHAGPYGAAQRVELPRSIWPWLVPLFLIPFCL